MRAARTGRKPAGPQIVERLEGSQSAKQRLEVILETVSGRLTIPEACRRLGICESRFHVLREETLQATLENLEPRRLGRPPKLSTPEQSQIDSLQQELDRARAELELTKVQLSLARIHPGLVPAASPEELCEKKNARRACRQ
jgi:hypothetical protein